MQGRELLAGIGPQTNNGLAAATVYAVNSSGANAGTLNAAINSTTYPAAYVSGVDASYFLSSAITGYPACTNPNYYCPSAQQTATANITGTNGATGTVTHHR